MNIKLRLLPLLIAGLVFMACGYSDPGTGSQAQVGATGSTGDDFHAGETKTPIHLPSGVQYVDLKVGTGEEAIGGADVTVQYTGWLTDGTQFDTSRQSGRTPFELTIGQGSVIPGWDEGLPGMKVGGKRKLIIPPAMGYGSQAQGPIPANATLVFDIELLTVIPYPSPSPIPTPSPTITPSPSPS
ncbi:MAG TPA: FKBP-type peptidyl-prolyl cis-trans isomerase [Candidatus Dormibacteraeota bacterium]|jgi:FKBP-type peptidyl-prolyl cis-trans isomerase|nr:FKBP-type peptidyl-prolyl cis-trans isomerase [Candidatus Dormibacteraeota bacterium]